MPSRKRNKGKERKAKKAEQELKIVRERWQGWARGKNMLKEDGSIITQCNHGCALMIPNASNNHPVTSFMDVFALNTLFDKHISDNLRDTFNTCPEVWNDDSHRKMARNSLLRIGTNMILGKVLLSGMPKDIAYAVVVLENYDGSGDIDTTMSSRVVASKYKDLTCRGSGFVRDLLKIYRKRLSCSCLKKMHLEARKTLPKMGGCKNCQQEKDRAMLSVCSKCRISHYCSRECQIEDWPRHKRDCDILCAAHQRKRQNDL